MPPDTQAEQASDANRFGFRESPDDRLQPYDSERLQKLAGRELFPVASVICSLILLLFGLVARVLVLIPVLGYKLSFVAGSVLLWLLVYRLLAFCVRRFEPDWLAFAVPALNRSTGLLWLNGTGLVLCGLLGVYLLVTAPLLSGYAFYGFMAFYTMVRTPALAWPSEPRIYDREKLPEPEEVGSTPGDGKAFADFAWTVLLGPNLEKKTFFVRIAVDLKRYAEYQKNNPFHKQRSPEEAQPGNGEMPPGANPQYALMVKELIVGGITDEVRQLAAHLLKLTRDNSLSVYDEVNNVLACVQEKVKYADDPGGEYWRYPLESIVDAQGDCDCKAILAATLYTLLGHECVILISTELGHAACGVAGAEGFPHSDRFYRSGTDGGRCYFYCETTGDGWRVGEVPENTDPNKFQEYPVK